jgi:hypothetical protein
MYVPRSVVVAAGESLPPLRRTAMSDKAASSPERACGDENVHGPHEWLADGVRRVQCYGVLPVSDDRGDAWLTAVRKVVYSVVYEIEVKSTGISSHPDVVRVHTPEEAGAAVVEALRRGKSWNWISIRETEVRDDD